ncbi:MAG: hypothetical protein LBG28_08855 [Tannerella sp.]|jgi:hypothetical protein|nr:hypothetical protein [Tannerella sp.]
MKNIRCLICFIFCNTLLTAQEKSDFCNQFRDLQSDTWVATDALGRSLPGYETCGPLKENRTVGMFYFMTLNNNGAKDGPYDVSKIIAENPENPQWGNGAHYWGEPEAGYYIMKDEWIIRRHARQLIDAGVDVIILDNTNDVIYKDVFVFIADVFRKMRAEGERTPQITCLASQKSIQLLWEQIYSRGLYADLWFRWKGKPLLLFGQHIIGDRQEMDDVTFPDEITSFFTIRQSWAWTTLKWYDNGYHEWPWVDHYPQSVGWSESPDRAEYVPVAVAQHPLSNIGRSFHNGAQPATDKYDVTPDTDKGLYFEEQWQRALEVDPEFVFVTGWNEWTAGQMIRRKENYEEEMKIWDFFPGANCGRGGREIEMGETYFIDQYNREYSRDVEPMKDGHSDNFYYQLMANIRKYKGVRKPEKPVKKSVDISGSPEQWDSITKTYYDHTGDVFHRNSPGNFAAGPYINTTGRNDIVESKVTCDDKNVYFYVKTADNLTSHTDPYWMLLFIDTDQNHQTGWEGYDLLINESFGKKQMSVIKAYKNGKWENTGNAAFRYEKNELMINIPRSLFKSKTLAFDFHWSDNIQQLGDIREFFLNGDQAPSRRANYRFEE